MAQRWPLTLIDLALPVADQWPAKHINLHVHAMHALKENNRWSKAELSTLSADLQAKFQQLGIGWRTWSADQPRTDVGACGAGSDRRGRSTRHHNHRATARLETCLAHKHKAECPGPFELGPITCRVRPAPNVNPDAFTFPRCCKLSFTVRTASTTIVEP